MSIDHYLLLDTDRSLEEIKATVLATGLFEDTEDFEGLKGADSAATNVTFYDRYAGPRSPHPTDGELGTGVKARKRVSFTERDHDNDGFCEETIRTIVALLKATPDDAYMEAYGDIPALLRKDGRLTLASRLAEPGHLWSEKRPHRALIDIPYEVAPLVW